MHGKRPFYPLPSALLSQCMLRFTWTGVRDVGHTIMYPHSSKDLQHQRWCRLATTPNNRYSILIKLTSITATLVVMHPVRSGNQVHMLLRLETLHKNVWPEGCNLRASQGAECRSMELVVPLTVEWCIYQWSENYKNNLGLVSLPVENPSEWLDAWQQRAEVILK